MTTIDFTPALLPDIVLTPAERIWDAVHHIEAHPEEWNMLSWGRVAPCGTTYCLAVHVITRAGYRMVLAGDGGDEMSFVSMGDLPQDVRDAATATCCTAACGYVEVDWLAEYLLGIDGDTGSCMWYLPTDLARVRDRVTEIFGPDPYRETS